MSDSEYSSEGEGEREGAIVFDVGNLTVYGDQDVAQEDGVKWEESL